MILFKETAGLHQHLSGIAKDYAGVVNIGLVPTMGALHEGHLSLIKKSIAQNSITVCSIFVNPLQFNNASDLEKYPHTLEADMELLNSVGCDILFAPNAREIYRNEEDKKLNFDIGFLDSLFEGALRPGHFKGVAIVVHRLFDIVKPTNAYFGLKDYQQCMLISKMVKDLALPITLHLCPTLREPDGLAMSSRNMRLPAEARKVATKIYEVLEYARINYRTQNITTIESWCKSQLSATPLYQLEYFNIVNAETLLPIASPDEPAVALCAAFVGEVRLIDNMVIN